MSMKETFMLMILALLLMGIGRANAAEGVLACVGRHMEGATNASFQLSNFNDNETITIDRILVHDMGGVLLCEGPSGWVDPLPTVIAPNGGTWFSVARMINREWCPDVHGDVGWVIVKIYWSSSDRGRYFAPGRVLPLYGRTTEVMPEMGRASLECDTVRYSKR